MTQQEKSKKSRKNEGRSYRHYMSKQEKFKILVEEFKKRHNRTLDVYDDMLRQRLGDVIPKTVQRLMESFNAEYNALEEIPKQRRKTYKLLTPVDIVVESLDVYENISWIFDMIHQKDPTMYKDLEHLTTKDKSLFMFKSTPLEDFETIEANENFQKLKRLIQAREYVKITASNDKTFDNLKPLKLIFIDNNWYVAIVDNEEKVRLLRLAFIKKVEYASNEHSFQPSSVQKHLDFLEHDLQNSLTRYGVKPKTATLKALPKIARYFEEGMKPFLPSQQFIKKEEDGSIIFTITYTQPLEVLPFVQKWLPELLILEPKELKEAYKNNLEEILKKQSI